MIDAAIARLRAMMLADKGLRFDGYAEKRAALAWLIGQMLRRPL